MIKKQPYDLVIVGGGIMGLFTAYYASLFNKKILLLEKRTIGNKYAGSSGFSRSIRNDYLDPYYSRLASESKKLWEELETKSKQEFIIKSGVLNIAKKNTTPNLSSTYTMSSYKVMKSLGFKVKKFTNNSKLSKSFPQFKADLSCLDIDAGFLYIPTIFKLLTKLLKNKVTIKQNSKVINIKPDKDITKITLKSGQVILTKKLALTVGAWTIEMLNNLKGGQWLKLPVIPVKQKLKYFKVPKKQIKNFQAKKLPVFAYLDVGIYGHPTYKKTPGLKIAYFDPFGAKLTKSGLCPPKQNQIKSQADFINQCLPSLKPIKLAKIESGFYQMTPDNDFIVSLLPGYKNTYIAAGFCGTGYKFAPLVGRSLAEMIFRKGSPYDLSRFNAKRFGKISNLSILKTIPMYVKFFNPSYWKFLKLGIKALTTNQLP